MQHKNKKYIICGLTALSALFLGACNDGEDDSLYPSIINEFAIAYTDADTCVFQITTDDGHTFPLIQKRNIRGGMPNAKYRGIASYTVERQTMADLCAFTGTPILHDSTEVVKTDATGVESVWMGNDYVNLHLTPKSQGGTQYWGYATDSISADSTHYYLRLHHRQLADQPYYTATLYASIDAHELPSYHSGDTISLRINTYNGVKTWTIHQ